MAIRVFLCSFLLVLALAAQHAEARIKAIDLVVQDAPTGVVLAKGVKRLNIRPAPRQRAQPRLRNGRPGLRRPAPGARVKRAARPLQQRVPRVSAITGRKAAKAKTATPRKPTSARVAKPRERLAKIRNALRAKKPIGAVAKATPKAEAVRKAKPLTRARLAAVSKSLKSAGNKIKLDNRLTGHRTIATGRKAFDQVPKQFRQQTKDSFQGEVRAIRLTRPMVVQRRYGGTSAESGGAYFTRQSYASRAIAKVRLALPRGNKANLKTTHIIPKGAVILVGRTASQRAGKTFGVNAKGGGEQIYVVNPKLTKSLKMTGGLRP